MRRYRTIKNSDLKYKLESVVELDQTLSFLTYPELERLYKSAKKAGKVK